MHASRNEGVVDNEKYNTFLYPVIISLCYKVCWTRKYNSRCFTIWMHIILKISYSWGLQNEIFWSLQNSLSPPKWVELNLAPENRTVTLLCVKIKGLPGWWINKGNIVRVSWTTSAMEWQRITLVLVTWSSATAAIRFPSTWRVKWIWVLAKMKANGIWWGGFIFPRHYRGLQKPINDFQMTRPLK